MSFFNHVQLHEYDLTNKGISQACYDDLVASGNNSTEDQLRILADSMREDFKTFLNKVFFIENRAAAKTVGKVAHKSPKVPHRVCIISICSILILLSILRSLTQSCVHPHRMRIQFSKLQMSVGVYASICPKSTDILKYITVNASWVNTEMDSNPTVLFYWKKSGLNPVDKVAHTYTTGLKNHVY